MQFSSPSSAVGASADVELIAAVGQAQPVQQVRVLTDWVGDGRKLTQTGRVTLADARELVALLGTGDEVDGKYRVVSSADLPGITTIVEWAKAARLVRVAGGRLLRVKKNARLLDRPLELWGQLFAAFPRLGGALCPPGWGESLMRRHFDDAVGALVTVLHGREGVIGRSEACALAWDVVTARYILDAATDQQLTTWRKMNDRDVRHALGVLEALGAITREDERVALTELGWHGVRRAVGEPAPGEAVLQVRSASSERQARGSGDGCWSRPTSASTGWTG